MKGRIEKWCCVQAADKARVLPQAMEKVAEIMEKIVGGRQPLFFFDGDVTSMLFLSVSGGLFC